MGRSKQRGTVVEVFDFGARNPLFKAPEEPKSVPISLYTHPEWALGGGAVENKK